MVTCSVICVEHSDRFVEVLIGKLRRVRPSGVHVRPATALDFADTPFLAVWETTRDCDLTCTYCRARDLPPSSDELTTEEGLALLNELARMGTPFCVLSGGDPAKRGDLSLLVRHGSELGISIVTILAATRRLNKDLVSRLKSSGLVQMALNLNGPREGIHDAFQHRGGAFLRTLLCASYAEEAGLPLQINTMFSGDGLQHFDAMAALVNMLRPVTWEIFMLVPTGAARAATPLAVQPFEEFLARIAELSHDVDFEIKVSEAPQYCRFVMREAATTTRGGIHDLLSTPARFDNPLDASARQDFSRSRTVRLARTRVDAGNGLLFISSSGDIYPSELLPLACGNVRHDSLQRVYRDHPTFCDLRNTRRLKGKCGICEYRHICGGSRARAYAVTGDYLAEDAMCSYQPV